jgi:hypothetical protein
MSFYKLLSELFVIPSLKIQSGKDFKKTPNIFNNIIHNISKLFKTPQLIYTKPALDLNDNYGVWDDIPNELYIIGDIASCFFYGRG